MDSPRTTIATRMSNAIVEPLRALTVQRLPLILILCLTAGLCAWGWGRRGPAGLAGGTPVLAGGLSGVRTPLSAPERAGNPQAEGNGPGLEGGWATDLLVGMADGSSTSNQTRTLRLGESEGASAEDPEAEKVEFVTTDAEGSVRVEATRVNGIFHGPWQATSMEGEILAKGQYVNGERAGAWNFWREGGHKRAQGSYEKNLKVGTWFSYHDNGQPERMVNYQDGEPNGVYFEWYTNGEVRSMGTFVMGRREGAWVFKDYDGQEDSRSGDYQNGKRIR